MQSGRCKERDSRLSITVLIAAWWKAFSRFFTASYFTLDVKDRWMERPVTEKLIHRGERLGLHTRIFIFLRFPSIYSAYFLVVFINSLERTNFDTVAV